MKTAALIIWFIALIVWADIVFGAATNNVATNAVVVALPASVVLYWPAQTNGGYVITAATNLLGPWMIQMNVPFPAGGITNPAQYPMQFFRAYTALWNTNGTWTVASLNLLTNPPPAGYTWELITN